MKLQAQNISEAGFAPYGQVIRPEGDFSLINAGLCRRFTDLATLDILEGSAGLSLFQAELRSLPYTCDLLERHPLGSQCFIPMGGSSYLVIVARDDQRTPVDPEAFLVPGDVSINIARNTWHGVLTPLSGTGLFAVIDRIAAPDDLRSNLEEYPLKEPLLVEAQP